MARKILSAELNWIRADDIASYVKVDDEVEIDWKFRIGMDDAGTLVSGLPPYDLKVHGITIASLTAPDEIMWVRKATDENPEAGAVGRINEFLYSSDDPRKITGLKVEVLTGVDAKAFKSRNEYEAAKQGFVKFWWIIPILLLLIWWKG
ncbi:hypothetical protein GOL45_30845 [Sinorhizobium medicae]|nr:hypothetical protein [Sinorhizobium medicae]MDX1066545.1 hypothetical protein [Sinorhizobium medicae]MDX2330273.1 hypothetical protein [Sinorhizobium medicae]